VRQLLAVAATTLAGAHLFVLLVTGGYQIAVLGVRLGGRRLFPAATLFFAALLASRVLASMPRWRSLPARDAVVIIFSALMIVYLANGKTIYTLDTIPARYLPLSIVREGDFDLDEFTFLYADGTPPYLLRVNGHYISNYPVGAALVALPVYLLSALGSVPAAGSFTVSLEKLAAAMIVAASAGVLYALLRRLVDGQWALMITAVYALGSSSFSVSSQALWQHGASQVALTCALYCLVRARSEPAWAGMSGFPLALAVIVRPIDAVLVAPLALCLVVRHPRAVLPAGLLALVPFGFQLWYNVTYFGNAFRTQVPLPFASGALWTTPLLEGLGGLLFSPGRGLIVYSPVFLFSAVGLAAAWRAGGDALLRAVGVGVVLSLLLYAKWFAWWGGGTYGPRYLADLCPGLSLALYPLRPALGANRALKIAFIVTMAWSIGVHAIGAFADDRHWSLSMDVDRSASVWSWSDNQLGNPARRLLDGAMISFKELPTSRTRPDLIAVSYATNPSDLAPAPRTTELKFSLEAANTGRAVWLAFPRRGSSSLGLVWRLQAEDGALVRSGWMALRHNVFPGGAHRFWLSVPSPDRPGMYVLEARLARGGTAPVGDGLVRARVTMPPE
jgi:hypothetical protein